MARKRKNPYGKKAANLPKCRVGAGKRVHICERKGGWPLCGAGMRTNSPKHKVGAGSKVTCYRCIKIHAMNEGVPLYARDFTPSEPRAEDKSRLHIMIPGGREGDFIRQIEARPEYQPGSWTVGETFTRTQSYGKPSKRKIPKGFTRKKPKWSVGYEESYMPVVSARRVAAEDAKERLVGNPKRASNGRYYRKNTRGQARFISNAEASRLLKKKKRRTKRRRNH